MEAKGKNGQSNCNLYLIHLHVQIHCKRMEAYFSQISLSFFNWLFWHSSATSVNFWISCGGGGEKKHASWLFYMITSKAPFPSPTPHQTVSEVRKICDFSWCFCAMCAKSLQMFLTLWDPVDSSSPSSSVHGVLQARIWVGCHLLLQVSKSNIVRHFTTHR